MRRVRSRQRSQSVVEFGLLALLFTLILFGIADFGMLLNGWVAVSAASREGARRASVGAEVLETVAGEHGVIDSVQATALVPGVPRSQVKVVVFYDWPANQQYFCSPGASAPPGRSCSSLSQVTNPGPPGPYLPPADIPVTVTVTADTFEVITPLVRPFFGCDGSVPHCYVPLISSTTMRYEGR